MRNDVVIPPNTVLDMKAKETKRKCKEANERENTFSSFSCVHMQHFHNIMLPLLLLLCVYFRWVLGLVRE